MSSDPRARHPTRRSALDSPWLATALAVILIALGAIIVLPGLLAGPAPSATPGGSPSVPPPSLGPTGAPTFARPTPSPAPSFTSYVVQVGDSLNSIAKKFRTTARSIAWWNRGAYPTLDPESPSYQPNNLKVGWILTVLPDSVVDENNPPTPSPGPSLPPSGSDAPSTPRPTASAVALGPATLVSHGSRSTPRIAFTFDMGGRLDPAVDIVTWLIDHEVHATIFPTGQTGSTTDLGHKALVLAATRPDLFDFGNHSWDHPDFRGISAAQMAQQLLRTEDALSPVIGTTKPWFRPPFGGTNDAVRAGVGAAGWSKEITWDVDMIDWRPESDGGPSAADMVAKLTSKAQNGSIVLMHLGGYHTLEALPNLLAAAQAKGLAPVTLTELLAA